MKYIFIIFLLLVPLSGVAASPNLDQRLPDNLQSAIKKLNAVQDQLEAEDYFSVSSFVIRALWCEEASYPIHKGLSIRQAMDLDTELEQKGGDLFKKAEKDDPDDVARVCGGTAHGA